MIDLLDIFIATAAVILGLSLVVQAIQQILKQALDLKSTYMKSELLALFDNPKARSNLINNFLPVSMLMKGSDPSAMDIVQKMEDRLRSFGFKDLHLLENVSTDKVIEMLTHLELPQDRLSKAIHQVEQWFDVSKQAFQEHYERRMKYWSFLLSAVVVVLLNANVIGVFTEFKSNKPIRDAVVASAPQLMQLAQRESTAVAVAPTQSTADSTRLAIMKQHAAAIQSIVDEKSFSICRWNTSSGDAIRIPSPLWRFSGENSLQTTISDFINASKKNMLGWLGMTLLVSLGAPFWYDFLKTLMGIKDSFKSSSQSETQNSSAQPIASGALPSGGGTGAAGNSPAFG